MVGRAAKQRMNWSTASQIDRADNKRETLTDHQPALIIVQWSVDVNKSEMMLLLLLLFIIIIDQLAWLLLLASYWECQECPFGPASSCIFILLRPFSDPPPFCPPKWRTQISFQDWTYKCTLLSGVCWFCMEMKGERPSGGFHDILILKKPCEKNIFVNCFNLKIT